MDDETAIRGVVAAWMAATEAGDHANVLDLMTDDVVFLVPGRAPFGKRAFAEASASAAVKLVGRSDILELQVLGDWAFARSHIAMTATPAGATAIEHAGHALTLFRKDGGRWQVARDANFVARTSPN